MQPVEIPQSPIRRALVLSAVFHVAIVLVVWATIDPHEKRDVELINIEMAPTPPPVEALPREVARAPVEDLASKQQEPEKEALPPPPPVDEPAQVPVDAAVADAAEKKIDAPIDAPPDAEPQIAKADAHEIDAAEPVAVADAGVADATEVAVVDAGVEDAPQVATGSGSGSGSGAGSGSGVLEGTGSGSGSGGVAKEVGSGSGSASTTTDPALAGAPTTAGTAANLLTYFPPGHEVTVLIRWDRLRGTEWAPKTERLMRPMPDFLLLFGPREVKLYEKLDALVISTPQPRDPAATTLVGRTRLARADLRAFLAAQAPVKWFVSKGGVLGRRTRVFPNDKRVFLSPFENWFLLAQPSDLAGLTAPAPGNLDSVVATGKLPPWLAGIRTIERESGDPRGPALVLTMALDGSTIATGPFEIALGVKDVQLPERVSLAMELVTQGWLARGNMRFKTEAHAQAFLTQVNTVQSRIVGAASLYERLIGKGAMNMIKNFRFIREGQRISYSTSMSIADMRALMSVAAQQLDAYYAAKQQQQP